MTRHLLVCAATIAFSGATRAEQVAAALTGEQIEEAIRLASDEKAARKFLLAYIVQARSGMGEGPRIGYFSTPYSRIVLAALAARKEGKPFGTTDVDERLIAPQLHVVALNLPAAYDPTRAMVREIVIVARPGPSSGEVIEPTSRTLATPEHHRLYEITPENEDAVVAMFPIAALAAGKDLRVSYTHVVRGSSAVTNCKDCVVPLFSTRVR